MSTEIELIGHKAIGIKLSDGSLAEKTKLLEQANWLEVVDSDESQKHGIEVQRDLKKMLAAVEASRKDVKAPLLAITKQIDGLAKDFCAELQTEHDRIQAEVSKWAEQKLADQREAEAKAEAERRKAFLEAQKVSPEAALAEATRQAYAPAVKVEKIEGTVTRERWVGVVYDLMELVQARPDLVRMEPKQYDINLLAGPNASRLAGVRFEKSVTVGTR